MKAQMKQEDRAVTAQMGRVKAKPQAIRTCAALMAFIALTLSACTAFGPTRNPPKIEAVEHYSVATQAPQLPSADGVAQAVATGAHPVPEWWKAYQSDDLNALVEEGLKNSPSLASAQSTLKAAREQLRSQ